LAAGESFSVGAKIQRSTKNKFKKYILKQRYFYSSYSSFIFFKAKHNKFPNFAIGKTIDDCGFYQLSIINRQSSISLAL
jgi:hypothetical protein